VSSPQNPPIHPNPLIPLAKTNPKPWRSETTPLDKIEIEAKTKERAAKKPPFLIPKLTHAE
jgi:hypothetical protein